MSATFKNAKKKLSQEQLRKMMKEHQKISKVIKKIDSPLAKYNEQGQLTCVLCKSIVRSEAVWSIHVNAKQHKQNVELAKKLKERTKNFTTPLKRSITPPLPEVPEKKIKGILKNAQPLPSSTQASEAAETNNKENGQTLPSDFFDSSTNKSTLKLGRNDRLATMTEELEEKKEDSKGTNIEEENKDVPPEGFFDDPKLDAKARNQEYKDPVEEEWEKFIKEIKDADNKSAAIIAEDQEEATTERQIDEIDEQIKKLNKVLDLEKKKEEIVTVLNEVKNENFAEDEEEEEVDFDEFLDWRAKKSFK